VLKGNSSSNIQLNSSYLDTVYPLTHRTKSIEYSPSRGLNARSLSRITNKGYVKSGARESYINLPSTNLLSRRVSGIPVVHDNIVTNVHEVNTKTLYDPLSSKVYKTTTRSPIRYIEPITTTSTISSIHAGQPKVVYSGKFDPIVTSIRQVPLEGQEVLTGVNTKIL